MLIKIGCGYNITTRAVMLSFFLVRLSSLGVGPACRWYSERGSLGTVDYGDWDGAVVLGDDGLPLKDRSKNTEKQTGTNLPLEADSEVTFRDLGVTGRLLNSLKNTGGIIEPNAIQKMALPVTYKRGKAGSCIIQSETGSGKTLTYLLPALQDIRPGLTSLIVTPTRELAVQVCYWAQKLSGTSKVSRRVSLLVSGRTEETLMKKYHETRPHILIGTPKILDKIMEDGGKADLDLYLQRVVLDEADILLDPLHPKASWRVKQNRIAHPKPSRLLLEKVLNATRKRKDPLQLICASATIPSGLQQELIDVGWAGPLQVLTTNKAAKQVPQCIDHTYITCDTPEEKLTDLVRHFKENQLKSALVFVHRDASVSKYTKELRNMGVVTEALYAHMDDPVKMGKVLKKFENGEIQLMIGNEETVRGLDFPFLQTVYLMEVPRTATEYLHLSGRVGRCGQRGHVIVLLETPQEIGRMERMYSRLGVDQSPCKLMRPFQ